MFPSIHSFSRQDFLHRFVLPTDERARCDFRHGLVRIDCATKTVHIPDRGLEIYCTHHLTSDLPNLPKYDIGPKYLIVCMSTVKNSVRVDSLPIVRDFPDVYPEDIESLPPERELVFSIELIPRAGPVSKAPYQMTLLELAEVKR